MKKKHKEHSNNFIKSIGNEFNKLIPSTREAAKNYIDGKGLKPLAEVSEINANTYSKLASINNEHQRLEMEHKEKMYQLRTERQRQKAEEDKIRAEAQEIKINNISNAIDAVKKLQELGYEVNPENTIKKLIK